MDFTALLRFAEQKQLEKKKELDRLHEKRQQEKLKEQQAQRQRARELKAKTKYQSKDNDTAAPKGKEYNGRIPKLNSQALKANSDGGSSAKISATSLKSCISNCHSIKRPVGSQLTNSKLKPAAASALSSSSGKTTARPESRNPYAAAKRMGVTREFPPRELAHSSKDVQSRSSGNDAALPGGRQQLDKTNKRRIYDQDDSDYDSELDDFIDKDDCKEDISSHIRSIFGYDKRRYRNLDDDSQMESSFAQVQREELISKKLGMHEDLKEMHMEALHKKYKMAKKRSKRIDD